MSTKDTNRINETAREIWLAGLGAVARAQTEGSKFFDGLVKEGDKLQTQTRKDLNKRVDSMRSDFESRINEVRTRATSNVHKLEKLFEARIARVLARLGVPTADDIQALSKRVQELSRDVKALNQTTDKAA